MKFIIVDEYNHPMAWRYDQLYYCTDDNWQDNPFPIKLYTRQQAKKLIERTIKFRKRMGYPIGNYKLMPVKIVRGGK